MVNISLDKLCTKNAEIYLVWTENILNEKPFGKNENVTIVTWHTLGVTWGALKRFCRRCLLRFQISLVFYLVWTKTFDTLSEFKHRIRIFFYVVWNGSFQTWTPHKRHESSEQTMD